MGNVKGVRISDRDIGFLTACGRYGLLSSDDAADYYPDRRRNTIQKRLLLLVQNQLIRGVKLQVWWASDSSTQNGSRGGRIPAVYLLTQTGAEIVEANTGVTPPRVLRSQPSPATFLHRRSIVTVMRGFDRSCRETGLALPDWVMEQDVWPNTDPKIPPNQRRLLYHEFEHGLTCLPDIACRFNTGSTSAALFWEVDLSTEGAKQLRRASKSTGYMHLFKERAYTRYWPDAENERPFVLWVAPSQRRIETIQNVLREHPVAPASRFLPMDAIRHGLNLLTEKVWQTVDGDLRAIYQPPSM